MTARFTLKKAYFHSINQYNKLQIFVDEEQAADIKTVAKKMSFHGNSPLREWLGNDGKKRYTLNVSLPSSYAKVAKAYKNITDCLGKYVEVQVLCESYDFQPKDKTENRAVGWKANLAHSLKVIHEPTPVETGQVE